MDEVMQAPSEGEVENAWARLTGFRFAMDKAYAPRSEQRSTIIRGLLAAEVGWAEVVRRYAATGEVVP